MDKIVEVRKEIDKLDDLIMQLLDQRYELTSKIGQLKSSSKTAILDTNREKIILDKISKYSHFPQIKSVYLEIMKESRNAQRK